MPNQAIADAIASGARLPPGEVHIAEPVRLVGGQTLRGSLAAGGTTLIPDSPDFDLVQFDNMDSFGTGDGCAPIALEDLTIRGSGALTAYQTGVRVRGAYVRLRRVCVTECFIGWTASFAVDVDIEQCVLRRNRYNIHCPGPNLSDAITTTRFIRCNIREAYQVGVSLLRGCDTPFDACIIESNQGWGVAALNTPELERVILRDCWLENNGWGIAGTGDIYDPGGKVLMVRGRKVDLNLAVTIHG